MCDDKIGRDLTGSIRIWSARIGWCQDPSIADKTSRLEIRAITCKFMKLPGEQGERELTGPLLCPAVVAAGDDVA
jgi:hypothetical protein